MQMIVEQYKIQIIGTKIDDVTFSKYSKYKSLEPPDDEMDRRGLA